jgi:hypothetical protein
MVTNTAPAPVTPSLFDEELLPLCHAAKYFPITAKSGKPPCAASIARWVTIGVKSVAGETVKLEAVKIGHGWATSREATRRFLERINAVPPTRPTETRKRQQDAAEKICSSFGA